MILSADIGGTHVRLALFEEKLVCEESFLSSNFSHFSEIVKQFLSNHPEKIEKGCFAVAGPVVDGKCQATNLPWTLDAALLSKELNIGSVTLINDLEATLWGVPLLAKEDLLCLNSGASIGNQAIIAAGTGLGEAASFWDGKKQHPFATEGGHADFAPQNELEMELLRHLQKRHSHVSYERVLSGPGLYNLYRFLVDMQLEKDEEMAIDAREVSERAIDKSSKACQRAARWFISLYGAEAGNVALKFLAYGGVYIGGGMAPKMAPLFQEGFMEAFTSKGRFLPLLKNIPVYLILNEKAALLGAFKYASG